MEPEQKENNYLSVSESIQVNFMTAIDKGSFEKVYVGKINHIKQTKECIVKIIKQKCEGDQGNTNFQKEADFSLQIIALFEKIRKQEQKEYVKIPLVEIFELVWGASRYQYCIAMEKCGNSLTSERYFLQGKKYLLIDAIIIVKQIAQGLQILHSENIIHRDLNPENIFVTENSSLEIKIGGYGLANITDDPKSTFDVNSYMAPEIAQKILDAQENMPQNFDSIKEDNNQNYSSKVNIWSLGTIFHELITGKKLFSKQKTVETLKNITRFGSYYFKWKEAESFSPPVKNEHLPQDLRKQLEFYQPWRHVGLDRVAKLLDQMLKRNPDERISAAEVVEECDKILQDSQLFKKQIEQIEEWFSNDEIFLDKMMHRKDLLENQLLELEQNHSRDQLKLI